MDIFVTFVAPVLIVLAIAALFAFSLSFVGEKLVVERDARIDEIERNLSGANCGGCGYAGCSQFAEALFKGEATLDRCNPTSKKNKENIAAILGMTAQQSEETVAVVHCNGGNKCRNKYDYQGFGDCTSAEIIAGGNKACSYGCIGFGTCSSSCGYNAIKVDKDTGVAKVDSSECVSCGACVAACPKKIIGRIPKSAAVYIACSNFQTGKEIAAVCKAGCIACGKCVRTCKVGAIELSNNLAVIDYSKCIGCAECADACPRKCILKRTDGERAIHANSIEDATERETKSESAQTTNA